MPAPVFLALCVGPVVVLLGATMHGAVRLALNTSAFLAALGKCLDAGNRERAEKLARVVDAPVAQLARYALELEVPRFGERAEAHDYRSGPDDGFEARARRALDAEAKRQLERFVPHAYASVLVFVTGATLFMASEIPTWGWGALVVGVFAAAANVRRYFIARRDLARTVDALVPYVHAA